MTIYVPQHIVPLSPTVASPLLFLAGPVRGGGDWQSDMAEEILNQEPSALITCPSRWGSAHKLAHHFHQPYSKGEFRQLVWERHYLKQSGLESNVPGCVIFWLGQENVENPHPGPESYAMDTRREIGKFTAFAEVLSWFPEMATKMDVRVVVGGDSGFYGLSVILFELREALGTEFPFHTTMAEVAKHALSKARQ